jgi:hypothetical protein
MIQANQLIQETIGIYQFKENGRYMKNLTEIKYNPDGISSIQLVTIGDEIIPDNVIATWRNQMSQYSRLEETDLEIFQGGKDDTAEKFNYVNELYESKKEELKSKDARIQLLENELAELSSFAKKQIPFNDISAEAKSTYDNLATLSFSYVVTTDFSSQDTIPVFEVRWKDPANTEMINTESKKLNDWLKIRLKDNKVIVKPASD